MLGQRHRHWSNIKTTSAQYLMYMREVDLLSRDDPAGWPGT